MRDTGSGEDKDFGAQQMQLGLWALPLSGYKALARSPVPTDAHPPSLENSKGHGTRPAKKFTTQVEGSVRPYKEQIFQKP